jgi:ABC-type uncharacterized transport system substrate-binding protein
MEWSDFMKRVYVCGSFRFVDKIEELEARLKKENIEWIVSKSMDARGILGCLEKIGQADVVYVVNPDGYVGKSVSVDIGYAYARNKPIYVMHPIEDPPVMSLVRGILSFEELISLLKHSDPDGR